MSKDLTVTQIMKHEGFRSTPYKDTVGVLTIGFGTNLDQGISIETGVLLLEQSLVSLKRELKLALSDAGFLVLSHNLTLSEQRAAVILNMVYNLGVPRLMGFKKMWKALAKGDFDTAAEEMLDSKWARQVGNRATELAEQMRDDIWVM